MITLQHLFSSRKKHNEKSTMRDLVGVSMKRYTYAFVLLTSLSLGCNAASCNGSDHDRGMVYGFDNVSLCP